MLMLAIGLCCPAGARHARRLALILELNRHVTRPYEAISQARNPSKISQLADGSIG